MEFFVTFSIQVFPSVKERAETLLIDFFSSWSARASVAVEGNVCGEVVEKISIDTFRARF
jgi:hypothetical protein